MAQEVAWMFVTRQQLSTTLDIFQEAPAGVRIQIEPMGDADTAELATQVTKLVEAYGSYEGR